jgi:hypothetical protein
MEASALATGATTSLGETIASKPAHRLDQTQRFEALLQPSSTSPATSWSSQVGDQYVDEVASPVASSSRAVTMPAELMSLGRTLSDELKAHKLEASVLFDDRQPSSPFIERYRAQLDALTKLQDSMTQYTLVMKGIELSSQSAQQLFKMQG